MSRYYYKRNPLYKKILVVANVAVIIAYLLVCLVPFVNTAENWFIALPGIVFPFLFFLLLAFLIVWAVLRSKWVWVCILVLLLGFQQITAVFSFHFSKSFSQDKAGNSIRVMQWNVMGWDQSKEEQNIESGGHALRPVMMNEMQDQNADILCLEEFYEPRDSSVFKSNIALITNMGYPYHCFSPTKNYKNDSTSGVIIFSKYPVIRSGQFDLDRNRSGDHLVYMDVQIGDKVFRIFATHLIPIKFNQWDETQEGIYRSGYRTILSRLIRGYEFRYYQAQLVHQKISESPYPVIICGDFNDIPNSNTYFEVKGDLQDPFLKKGFWTGRTTRKSFILASPRIDFILADKKFKVQQFQTLRIPYSDHYPVITDLQY